MTNESLRRQYLQAMGIDVWYARHSLPGAAPSPLFQFEAEAEPPPVAAPLPAPSRKSPKIPSTTKTPPEEKSDRQEPPKPGRGQAAQSRSGPEPGKTADKPTQERRETGWGELNLGIWQASSWVLVADWDPRVSDAVQDGLARNILRALGVVARESAGHLMWPAFKHPGVPGNHEGTLKRALERLVVVGDGVPRHFIVLGDKSLAVVESRIWPAAIAELTAESVTLAAMATEGELKRRLWNRLREHLRGRDAVAE